MRTPNAKCDICDKEFYRRPAELKKFKYQCCREHRSELYKRHPEIVKKNLSKGQGWNRGMSRLNGDELSYGKPRSEITKSKISQKLMGRMFSEKHKTAISNSRIELFDKRGRVGRHDRGYMFARWKRAVYKRDHRTCQKCQSKEKLRAHHILSWKDYPELRFELSNGITLCKSCHDKLHINKSRNNQIHESVH